MSLPVTEDTPPDMLAGSMDLNVVLPKGQTVRMSVQRGTPMMDLLVQVTTAHCLSPGDYSLQAMGDKGVLPFKPNTPIGALDTFTVKIVEKKSQNRGRAPQVPQSFLNSFRLQVHLPRSQLFVLRVTPDVTLSEVMNHICTEKNLNLEKYEFRNPAKLDEVLELNKALGDYKLQELSLVSKGNRTVTNLMSSADVIKLKSSKHRQNSVCDSSLSSGSFGSRSGSPVPVGKVMIPPQPPIRKKRRPAPKPPSYVEKEKKDRNSTSVLISHSRESSDSSGYHEASVLSESPTHGGPGGGTDGDSPPDTLPRRSKLPSSQSFTNLTSIQPAPKGRLITSVSNTSLNSNGYTRKKRAAPPPPQSHATKEEKIKSSTLPISIKEEWRNGSSFTMTDSSFTIAKVDDAPLDVSNAKVQNSVEITSRVVNKTKASKDDVPSTVDIENRIPPKPKPRTVLLARSYSQSASLKSPKQILSVDLNYSCEFSSHCENDSIPNQRYDYESLNEEEKSIGDGDETKFNMESPILENYESNKFSSVERDEVINGHSFLTGHSGTKQKKILFIKSEFYVENSPNENLDQTDHDSISWEYQLPPPPTDFRDTNSPNCTEFGTITITPEVLEKVDHCNGEEILDKKSELIVDKLNGEVESRDETTLLNEINGDDRDQITKFGSEKKLSQSKTEVMNELTNILNGSRREKEKSQSFSNLYIGLSDPVVDYKKKSLNYSRSFTTEPSLCTFTIPGYDLENNKKFSRWHEADCDNEITYRNYKNLEKSSSLECIQINKIDNNNRFIEKSEEVFRKPIAPVQKKKMAKRSASSLGVNMSFPIKKNTQENGHDSDSWSDDPNIDVLKQQFLEFLKEKKLMNADLKIKSLDVIRNILPEFVNNSEKENSIEEKEEKNSKKEDENSNISHDENAQSSTGIIKEKEAKVKVVDVKVKSTTTPDDSSSEDVVLRHGNKVRDQIEKRESMMKFLDDKKPDLVKRYSYQGPPSINFGTWGERPKTTRIIIKDEDYVTQENVTKNKPEKVPVKVLKNEETSQKAKEAAKKTHIVIKKPGVLSHYEMFSALPRKKEINSLKLMFMDDEEKKKMNLSESKNEQNRVPVVCGVELKKEFKHIRAEATTPAYNKPSRSPSSSPPTVNNKSLNSSPPPSQKSQILLNSSNKSNHSVSVYINGNQDNEEKSKPEVGSKLNGNFILPKRNPTLMPVVKGFRPFNNSTQNGYSDNTLPPTSSSKITVNFTPGNAREPINNHNEKQHPFVRPSQSVKTFSAGTVPLPPPPPLPNVNSIKLKSATFVPIKPKIVAQDSRSQLLDEIRNFGGLKKLKKSTVH